MSVSKLRLNSLLENPDTLVIGKNRYEYGYGNNISVNISNVGKDTFFDPENISDDDFVKDSHYAAIFSLNKDSGHSFLDFRKSRVRTNYEIEQRKLGKVPVDFILKELKENGIGWVGMDGLEDNEDCVNNILGYADIRLRIWKNHKVVNSWMSFENMAKKGIFSVMRNVFIALGLNPDEYRWEQNNKIYTWEEAESGNTNLTQLNQITQAELDAERELHLLPPDQKMRAMKKRKMTSGFGSVVRAKLAKKAGFRSPVEMTAATTVESIVTRLLDGIDLTFRE